MNFEKLTPAIEGFETTVLKIKGSGDKQTAEELKAQYVDAKDEYAQIKQTITERYLRTPKGSLRLQHQKVVFDDSSAGELRTKASLRYAGRLRRSE